MVGARAISLLVGGIGIMKIMLERCSRERSAEDGGAAVGARPKTDIIASLRHGDDRDCVVGGCWGIAAGHRDFLFSRVIRSLGWSKIVTGASVPFLAVFRVGAVGSCSVVYRCESHHGSIRSKAPAIEVRAESSSDENAD